jgi:hypothetical protein
VYILIFYHFILINIIFIITIILFIEKNNNDGKQIKNKKNQEGIKIWVKSNMIGSLEI